MELRYIVHVACVCMRARVCACVCMRVYVCVCWWLVVLGREIGWLLGLAPSITTQASAVLLCCATSGNVKTLDIPAEASIEARWRAAGEDPKTQ